MSEESAFTAALIAAPDDATARLVYADWLDERGEHARADFLRLAARRAADDPAEVARREQLGRLSAGLEPEWLSAGLGMRVATVEARLPFATGAEVAFGDGVEVSLDCCVCRRCGRTVVFDAAGRDGRCTPTGHPFPGFLLAREAAGAGGVRYVVAYRYEPFVDAKHGDRRRPDGIPRWGRVSFSVTCPSCGSQAAGSTQTNMARPLARHCRCGVVLYREEQEMPVLSWSDGRAS